MTDTEYKSLLSKKKLTSKESKQLSIELNRKYCKCVKSVRKTLSKKQQGAEYPICTKTIYKNRGKEPPPNKDDNC
tara:strand:- start:275 stop:499 length:225 start_codon:yes stop_codon:yes gene_type:complete